MIILIFLIYFHGLWALWSWYNYSFIRNKKWHAVGALLACYITVGCILAPRFSIMVNCWQDAAWLFFIAIFGIRWNFGELILNFMLGKLWFEGGGGTIDKVLHNDYIRFVIKVICLFISLCAALSFGGIGIN